MAYQTIRCNRKRDFGTYEREVNRFYRELQKGGFERVLSALPIPASAAGIDLYRRKDHPEIAVMDLRGLTFTFINNHKTLAATTGYLAGRGVTGIVYALHEYAPDDAAARAMGILERMGTYKIKEIFTGLHLRQVSKKTLKKVKRRKGSGLDITYHLAPSLEAAIERLLRERKVN